MSQANDSCGTRVSIDFRVLPLHLHVPQRERSPQITSRMQTAFVLDEGCYYQVARVQSQPLLPTKLMPTGTMGGRVDSCNDAYKVTLALAIERLNDYTANVRASLTLSRVHALKRPPLGCGSAPPSQNTVGAHIHIHWPQSAPTI